MDGVKAGRIALESGRSDDLDQAIRALAETDLGHGPKYGPATVHAVARAVLGRAYAVPLFELCHLARIAERVGGRHGWAGFFFGLSTARASAFRGVFSTVPDDPRITVEEGGVCLNYDDEPFMVTFGRMSFLTALLELTISLIGFQAVDDVLSGLQSDPYRRTAARERANALARTVYAYLQDNHSSTQTQRVFSRIVDAASARFGANFKLSDLDDEFILKHWAEDAGEEIRLFTVAAEQVARFRSAFAAGIERQSLDGAASIGSDRSVGEVDPALSTEDTGGSFLAVIEAHEEAVDPLAALASPPADSVKFLNLSERSRAESLTGLGKQAAQLPLTVLRMDGIGRVQPRLIQALRSKIPGSEISALTRCVEVQPYAEHLDIWRDLHRHLNRVGLASLAILLENGRAEGLLELTALAPEFDPASLRSALTQDDTVVALRPGTLRDLATAASDPAVVGAATAQVVTGARASLRGLSRQGFGQKDRKDPNVVEGLAVGTPHARVLGQTIAGLILRAERALNQGTQDQFERDLVIFQTRYHALYAEQAA